MKRLINMIGYAKKSLTFLMEQLRRLYSSSTKRVLILLHFFLCVITDGCTPEEYIWLEFYRKKHGERKKFFTYTRQGRVRRKLNDGNTTDTLRNKHRFDEVFEDFLGREYLCADSASEEEIISFIKRHGTVIVKPDSSSKGRNVYKMTADDRLRGKQFNGCIIEEILHQHSVLDDFNPNSINTIRISSACYKGKVFIFSAAIRMSSNEACVDNAGSGGIFAQVDVKTGEITTDAVNEKCERFTVNPYSKKRIKGVQIPYWMEAKTLVEKAAQRLSDSSIVGWDVAITPKGPVLIEGNDDQDNAVMQMAAQTGQYRRVMAFLKKQQIS